MSSDREPLSVADAEEFLDGLPLVAALSGSIDEMKRVRAQCLAAGIPVLMGCPPGGGGKGWGTKTHLLVEEDDVPLVAQVLRGQWHDSVAREGLAPVARASAEACPACGAEGELVDGACPDCGLQLA